jgi:hypothetical protein
MERKDWWTVLGLFSSTLLTAPEWKHESLWIAGILAIWAICIMLIIKRGRRASEAEKRANKNEAERKATLENFVRLCTALKAKSDGQRISFTMPSGRLELNDLNAAQALLELERENKHATSRLPKNGT